MERDGTEKATNEILRISTHTLTWSVTKKLNHYYRLKGISTHTLTWSVTLLTEAGASPHMISTHTLTWSVTGFSTIRNWQNQDFNSHAHVERDYTTGAGTAIVFNFNSHAHVERDT